MHAAGFIEDGSVGNSISDPAYPTYLGGGRRAAPGPRSGHGVTGRDAERARDRDARRRGRVFSPPHPRRFQLAQGRGPRCRRRPSTTAARWICRSRSIAATSGTTFRSTPRACASRSRASGFPSSPSTSSGTASACRSCAGGRPSAAGAASWPADGQEYYRYKGSDVGPRVWRHIVTAPVWIPPATSPLAIDGEGEAGGGNVRARDQLRRDRARIHVRLRNGGGDPRGDAQGPDGARFVDNGIRTHGSFDYPSLRGRFSHGCHRLYNQLAMRLFSFVLRAPAVRVTGPVAAGYRRAFYSKGEVFEMRLPNRGYLPRAGAADAGRSPGGPHQGDADQSRSRATCRSRASRTCRAGRRRRRTRPRTRRAAGTRHEATRAWFADRDSRSLAGCSGRRREGPDRAAEPPPVAEVAVAPPPVAAARGPRARSRRRSRRRRHRDDQAGRRRAPAGARLPGDGRISASRRSRSCARAAARRWISRSRRRGACRCTPARSPIATTHCRCASTRNATPSGFRDMPRQRRPRRRRRPKSRPCSETSSPRPLFSSNLPAFHPLCRQFSAIFPSKRRARSWPSRCRSPI